MTAAPKPTAVLLREREIRGGDMVGPHAGDMIGEVAHGSCTDVLPSKR